MSGLWSRSAVRKWNCMQSAGRVRPGEGAYSRRTGGLYRDYIKRLLDVILSVIGILALWPLMAATALLVRIRLGTPVVFRQERPGKGGRLFQMYKFRTMTDERDKSGTLLPDEKRLTPFGKKLRASSLDELPELYNILKGDMSVVGPRPLLADYLPLYSKSQMRRHDVRPGLTGLAQVKGRNAISWEERFHWDVLYTEKLSFWMDVFIFVETIKTVLKRDGIQAEGSATMEAFRGNGK